MEAEDQIFLGPRNLFGEIWNLDLLLGGSETACHFLVVLNTVIVEHVSGTCDSEYATLGRNGLTPEKFISTSTAVFKILSDIYPAGICLFHLLWNIELPSCVIIFYGSLHHHDPTAVQTQGENCSIDMKNLQ